MSEMSPELRGRVLPRVLKDYGFKPSADGKWLNQGKCPACGKKELFTSADNPWVLRCGRVNKCGQEFSVRDLYPEEFRDFTKRFEATPQNPNATADAYMREARGLNTMLMKGYYTQEKWWSSQATGGTATVRFYLPKSQSFMERFVDPVDVIKSDGSREVRKQNFGGAHAGLWWYPPDMAMREGDEIWIVEGIIDAISLWQNGIKAVAILSCGNYPAHALTQTPDSKGIHWIWALDNDKAGKSHIRKHVARMRKDGYCCDAAIAPAQSKCDWNDLHRLGKLNAEDLPEYRYHGALLIARSVEEKAALIYAHGKSSGFVVDHDNELFWWEIDQKEAERLQENGEYVGADSEEAVYRIIAEKAGKVRPICNARPEFLYIQSNETLQETWFFCRVHFPDGRPPVGLAFSNNQITSPGEFKTRLASAQAAWWEGDIKHLNWIGRRWLRRLKTVVAIDHLGYSREHGCYIYPNVAVQDGRSYTINDEEFFELPKKMIKSLFRGASMTLETTNRHYRQDWVQLVWRAFGTNGIIAAVFWFGSLFAEQIRHRQSSFPFLEIIGEPGSGKTSLIEFIWKLFGRSDYEGIDPNKNSLVGNQRSLVQFANLPVVFIEADRAEGSHAKRFDWDETKGYYNGRGTRVRGQRNQGVETHEPPFRGTLVIAQNEPVNASDAVLERIVQLRFTKAGHNSDSKAATDEMQGISAEQLSYFTVLATMHEKEVVDYVIEKTGAYQKHLLEKVEGINHARLAKNHAQLLALTNKFAQLVGLTDEQRKATCAAIQDACVARQNALAADHPLVAEFWDTFDFLDEGQDEYGKRRSVLNHSRDPNLIAVNLNEFVEKAANARQQIPPLVELKKYLKSSKSRKFIEASRTVSSAIEINKAGKPKTPRCWIFQRSRAEIINQQKKEN